MKMLHHSLGKPPKVAVYTGKKIIYKSEGQHLVVGKVSVCPTQRCTLIKEKKCSGLIFIDIGRGVWCDIYDDFKEEK